jgi:hypothetical protein
MSGSDSLRQGKTPSRRDILRAAARRPARALRGIVKTPRDGERGGDKSEAPIFVSYARDDIAVARALVEYLRAHGAAVTWDQDLHAGADFERAIRTVIDAAPAAIVVWSSVSAASAFVRDEARRAMAAGKLVTTHVANFTFDEVPLGFGHLNAIPVEDRERLATSLATHGVRLVPGGTQA